MFDALIPLILASASPRRRDFLDRLGLEYQAIPADIDESPLAGEAPASFALRMAREKAARIAGAHPASCVIAADTVVALDEKIFGKPADSTEALDMLRHLRGRTHQVITGLAVLCGHNNIEELSASVSEVRFAFFDDAVLRAYIDSGDPMDKAGAYGIQGRGGFLVASIRGSCDNVAGLPVQDLIRILLRHGLARPKTAYIVRHR